MTVEHFKRKTELEEKIADIRVDFELNDLTGIIVETSHEADAVVDIIMEKYGVKKMPTNLKIVINSTRHIPDQG